MWIIYKNLCFFFLFLNHHLRTPRRDVLLSYVVFSMKFLSCLWYHLKGNLMGFVLLLITGNCVGNFTSLYTTEKFLSVENLKLSGVCFPSKFNIISRCMLSYSSSMITSLTKLLTEVNLIPLNIILHFMILS